MVRDFNGHVGKHSDGFHGMHRDYGLGSRNEDGTRLQEFCDANGLMVSNTNFRKPASLLITNQSGGHTSQSDHNLTRNRDWHMLLNTKSFSGEECTAQYRLVVSDFGLRTRRILSQNRYGKRQNRYGKSGSRSSKILQTSRDLEMS
eukprot:XP_014784815.1 PREDICTED: craniofacial development protein 2-like [Octopus bimaculoides]